MDVIPGEDPGPKTLASDMSVPLISADRKLIKALTRDLPALHCLDIMNLPEDFI